MLRWDVAVGLTAGLQLALAGIVVIGVILPGVGRTGSDPGFFIGVGVYGGLSAVAFVGSFRPTVPQRRPLYLIYMVAAPLVVVAATVLVIAGLPTCDRLDVCWQAPAAAAIFSPAWILLIVRLPSV